MQWNWKWFAVPKAYARQVILREITTEELLTPGRLGRTGPLLRVAITVYAALVVMMAGQAAGRWSVLKTPGTRSAGIGAVLFMISDGLLALDRFRASFPGARVAVLATYYVAQWLIARSTAEPSPEPAS
jgi:uncharacterized membrane protein YhhN